MCQGVIAQFPSKDLDHLIHQVFQNYLLVRQLFYLYVKELVNVIYILTISYITEHFFV